MFNNSFLLGYRMKSTNNYRPLSSVSESISYLEINGHESANCSFEQYKINALKVSTYFIY